MPVSAQAKDYFLPPPHSTVGFDPGSKLAIGDHFVALLDLLGQATKLRSLAPLPLAREPDPEFLAKLQGSIGQVLRLRHTLRSSFDGLATVSVAARLPKTATEEQIEIARDLDSQALRLMGASDTVVAFIPLDTLAGRLSLRGLVQSLAALSFVVVEALADGLVIRGALGVGVGCEITPEELYGPCLLDCLEAEKTVAEWPRIIAHGSLKAFLDKVGQDPSVGIVPDINRALASAATAWLYEAPDGALALDYIGPEMRSIGSLLLPDLVSSLIDAAHLRVELLQREHEGDPKLHPRYANLRQYFDIRNPGFDNARRSSAVARYQSAQADLPPREELVSKAYQRRAF